MPIDLVQIAAAQRAAKEESARVERARLLAMAGLGSLLAEASVAGFTPLNGIYADSGEKYYLTGKKGDVSLHVVATELVAGTYVRKIELTGPTLTITPAPKYTGTLQDLWGVWESLLAQKEHFAKARAELAALAEKKAAAQRALHAAEAELFAAEIGVDCLELELSVRISQLCMEE